MGSQCGQRSAVTAHVDAASTPQARSLLASHRCGTPSCVCSVSLMAKRMRCDSSGSSEQQRGQCDGWRGPRIWEARGECQQGDGVVQGSLARQVTPGGWAGMHASLRRGPVTLPHQCYSYSRSIILPLPIYKAPSSLHHPTHPPRLRLPLLSSASHKHALHLDLLLQHRPFQGHR